MTPSHDMCPAAVPLIPALFPRVSLRSQPLSTKQAFHSGFVTSNYPTAYDALIVTVRTGYSSEPPLFEPMRKLLAGTTPISRHTLRSLKLLPEPGFMQMFLLYPIYHSCRRNCLLVYDWPCQFFFGISQVRMTVCAAFSAKIRFLATSSQKELTCGS